MLKLTDIVAGDTVHITLRRPARLRSDGVYRVDTRAYVGSNQQSVSRGLGKVLSHDTANEVLTLLPAFEMDLGPNRKVAPVEVPWWCIRALLKHVGYTEPSVSRGQELGSTVFNQKRQAYIRELDPIPLEQPQAVPPAMTFEKVRLAR